MINPFPHPLPDELLYSLCARYSDRVMYPSKKAIMKELFGSPSAIAVADLPSRLSHLAKALPFGSLHTADSLINERTLLPLYSPFLEPSCIAEIRRGMKGNKGKAVHARSGITAGRISLTKRMRFCPRCVKEDRSKYGEAYWHRAHQAPGVEACHVHQVMLESGSVRTRSIKTRHEFVSAERALAQATLNVRVLDGQNPLHQSFLKVARDCAWLLSGRAPVFGLEGLRRRYLRLLADRGLASYSGRVHTSALLKQFTANCHPEILKMIGCEIGRERDFGWLLRLIRSPKGAQNPLYHLLLIHFLGLSTESFFSLKVEFFGRGPWPCLNRAADHYQEPRIKECIQTFTKDHGKPIGTFRCQDCGFSYVRTGPDRTVQDRVRADKIESFGQAWERLLRLLWRDKMVSLRGMARKLGVDPATVKRQAARLKLRFPRRSVKARVVRASSAPLPKPVRVEPAEPSLNSYRNAWLSAFRDAHDAGRTAVRNKVPRVYTWLRRNDSEWLEAHMPARRTSGSQAPRVDWKRCDAGLAEGVRFAALRIKNHPGRAVQVTTTSIARELGQLALIQKHVENLPLTAKAMSEEAETRESFAIRRLKRAAECYRKEGICLPLWQLKRRAGLRPDLMRLPKIKSALKAIMTDLGTPFSEFNAAAV